MPYTSRETYDFISKQTNDPIVEWKTCKVSGQPFPIYQSDVDFYDKISPTFNGKKYQIPTPTLCPEERQRRRFAFRNERKMYKTKASNNGQEILSLYSPDKLYKVYEHKFRDSDGWNVMMYNKEYNAELPFSKHLETLRLDIPRTNFLSVGNENGDYSNYVLNSKNTYMSYNIAFCENVFYATVLSSCTNCCDCTNANTLEWSYEIMN
ncbi:MAG: hypothetical protein LBG59_04270 [Candidatus Peribacteria bacterium]|jgi:hypothetical protein|nr:hypothetical protein [Candidatus Peribacteria bacterium]